MAIERTRSSAAFPSGAQARQWLNVSAVDFEIYELAVGTLSLRLGHATLPPLPPALSYAFRSKTLVAADDAAIADHGWRAHDIHQLRSSRTFQTIVAPGRRVAAVPPPLAWSVQTDTIVFIHIAKCGGTSFNRRLMSLDAGQRCVCAPPSENTSWHNGHRVVQPHSCTCPRVPTLEFKSAWSPDALALSRKKRRPWRFLQLQWLVSPETTGWIGGVHAPVRRIQAHLMLASRLARSPVLPTRIHYVTLLRKPQQRFLSEFYETYVGRGRTCSNAPGGRNPWRHLHTPRAMLDAVLTRCVCACCVSPGGRTAGKQTSGRRPLSSPRRRALRSYRLRRSGREPNLVSTFPQRRCMMSSSPTG